MPVLVLPDVDRVYFRHTLGMCLYTFAVGLSWLAQLIGRFW